MRRLNVKSAISVLLLFGFWPTSVFPCTVLFLPQSPDQVVAVNMDWNNTAGLIFINKRNVHKQSAFVGTGQTPLQWTSKYMSITFSQTGLEFPWEGMNEMGLSVHLLLSVTAIEPATTDPRPAINGIQWLQYILDTSSTTAEAIANAQATRVTGPFGTQQHYFVCDATGSCAAFDYINGTLVIAQGTSLPYPVLTNTPYTQALANLHNLLYSNSPGQILAMTATDSLTRFAKAAIWSSQYFPQDEEVSYGFSALNTMTESDTQWRIVFSLGNQSLQYESALATGLKYIDLRQFDSSCGSGVMLKHVNSQLSGDITSTFSPYSMTQNNYLVASNVNLDAHTISVIENYPSTTQCTETATTISSSLNPANLGNAVQLTAQVLGNGATAPTGTVTFMNNTVTLGTGSLNSAGVAQLSLSNLPTGSTSIVAVYNGDSLNQSSTSPPLWQGVNVLPTQVTLSSSANPANVGQSVIFKAAVSSQAIGAPTGTAALWDGATLLGTATLNAAGNAKFNLTLPAGAHSLSVVYSGDLANGTSTSDALAQTINVQSTVTDFDSSLNPSDVAQQVSLNASVVGQDSVPVTGTVTFRFGGYAVPPIVRLQNGQAILNKTFQSAGARTLTATYSGDINSQASQSSSLNQQVNAQPTQVMLTSPASSYAVGQTATITANVTGEYGGAPTGSVAFSVDNGSPTVVALNNLQATLSTSFSAPGSHIVSATYSGDNNSQSSSSLMTITVP